MAGNGEVEMLVQSLSADSSPRVFNTTVEPDEVGTAADTTIVSETVCKLQIPSDKNILVEMSAIGAKSLNKQWLQNGHEALPLTQSSRIWDRGKERITVPLTQSSRIWDRGKVNPINPI